MGMSVIQPNVLALPNPIFRGVPQFITPPRGNLFEVGRNGGVFGGSNIAGLIAAGDNNNTYGLSTFNVQIMLGVVHALNYAMANGNQLADINNIRKTNPALNTLAGATAGSVYWIQPEQGTEKIFSAWFAGYENDTTTSQTITLPTPFVYGGAVVTNTTGLTISVSTTTVTITTPDTTTTYTGFLHIRGI